MDKVFQGLSTSYARLTQGRKSYHTLISLSGIIYAILLYKNKYLKLF